MKWISSPRIKGALIGGGIGLAIWLGSALLVPAASQIVFWISFLIWMACLAIIGEWVVRHPQDDDRLMPYACAALAANIGIFGVLSPVMAVFMAGMNALGWYLYEVRLPKLPK